MYPGPSSPRPFPASGPTCDAVPLQTLNSFHQVTYLLNTNYEDTRHEQHFSRLKDLTGRLDWGTDNAHPTQGR